MSKNLSNGDKPTLFVYVCQLYVYKIRKYVHRDRRVYLHLTLASAIRGQEAPFGRSAAPS